ncbi:succinylarginine dihydrolase [Parasphingorhabdus marina DSM 22363]|uniref:N-succinylarginine dihydrolase n=1 Tax=Parasphingorhabdus marina DSM 22363 TaxID=1123272 RepID=A0A1N6GIG7_9SPHN|nr:N-succinylarginine dihydrolase [Parasphingorhabdus marina]SIO07340.1 succinylarginine dihydrolase [Parasphingorhabdus marina DSM 22363]
MSKLVEINFDGIIGPSHNYAGLSRGNIASSKNAGETAFPREAALQGLAKMRHNIDLGLTQGFFMPLDRPNTDWLASLGADIASADPHVRAAGYSASSMWAANAATVSPAPDSVDGKCHLTVANLRTMPHRSHEWPGTLAQLRLTFADDRHFAVHEPVPAAFGDEGAANHMRLCSGHEAPGLEIFVYGESGGPFPARQHLEASKAVGRLHQLDPAQVIYTQQSNTAIAAGAFHNDVVAVANGPVLFAHEQAFEQPDELYSEISEKFPEAEIVTVPADKVSLADAITSYLFNAQLVTLPDDGGMALVLPTEARDNAAVWRYLEELVAGNGPIRKLCPVDVRQSMANGGGPACLRLRVVADPTTVDDRFMATPDKLVAMAAVIKKNWPESIRPAQLRDAKLAEQIQSARLALLELCDLSELVSSE